VEIKDCNGKVIAKVVAADPNVSGCDEGIWLEVQADDGTRPMLCLVKDKPDGPFGGDWYIGAYRDSKQPGIACDLAISLTKDGPVLQAVRGKEVRQKSLFDLLA
jgi:hypothetical protein